MCVVFVRYVCFMQCCMFNLICIKTIRVCRICQGYYKSVDCLFSVATDRPLSVSELKLLDNHRFSSVVVVRASAEIRCKEKCLQYVVTRYMRLWKISDQPPTTINPPVQFYPVLGVGEVANGKIRPLPMQ